MTIVDRIDSINERTTKAHLQVLLQDAKSHIENLEKNKIEFKEDFDEDVDFGKVSDWIGNAKQSFVARFSSMEDDFGKLADKLERTRKSVESTEKRLSELFNIEKNLLNLAASVEAMKVASDENRKQKDALRKQYEDLRNDLVSDYERHKVELEQKQKDAIRDQSFELNKKERDWRENFEQNKFEKERKFKIEMQEKIDLLDKREESLIEKAEYFANLEEKVNAFPSELEAAVENAARAAVKKEEASYGFKIRHLESEKQNIENLLKQKIIHLESVIERLTEEKEDLAEKLEAAQERVQNIATKSVESARPQIINQSPGKFEK